MKMAWQVLPKEVVCRQGVSVGTSECDFVVGKMSKSSRFCFKQGQGTFKPAARRSWLRFSLRALWKICGWVAGGSIYHCGAACEMDQAVCSSGAAMKGG